MSPTAPHRFCATPGCTRRVSSGHCPEHADARRVRQVYAYTDNSLYSAAWRRCRVRWLATHPFCVACGRLANEVDHVVPHRGDLDRFWDEGNWQSMCRSCHSRKTRDEVIAIEVDR
jgi:5-methylcytosine-specific restriction protein A